MGLWIGTREADSGGEVTQAVIVHADNVDAAADEVAELLDEHVDYGGGDELPNVFVAPWDPGGARRAYRRRVAAEPAEPGFECCGGAHGTDYEHMAGGHWATCDERPDGTGQEREVQS